MTPAPYKHQLEGFARLKRYPYYALLCEMGAGKSRMICMDFEHKLETGEVKSLLLAGPEGSYRNWEGELKAWMSPAVYDTLYIYVWDTGKASGVAETRRFQHFLDYTGEKPRVLLVNFGSLGRVEKLKKALPVFLKSAPAMFVVDEAQGIKVLESQRTKFVLSLAPLAPFRRILSGLIAPENPLNVFGPYTFLSPHILSTSNFFAFRARYAQTKKMCFAPAGASEEEKKRSTATVVVSYRNLEELQRKLDAKSFRVRTADVVDLPERIYMPIRYVDMTPEQKAAYDRMKKWAMVELQGKLITAPIAVSILQKLQQLANGFIYTEEGETLELPCQKIASLMELLTDFDGKAIIWAQAPGFLRRISEALGAEYGKEAVVRFWGEVPSAEREEAKVRFQEDPKCRFMVANPAVGGEGNNWTAATLVVYMSNGFKNSERQQSEARAHRIGTTKPVTYVDIAARGTVDDKLIKALREKMDMASILHGEELAKWVI